MTSHEEEVEVKIERVGAETETEVHDLGDEFREFGRQLMRALRTVAGSDEMRKLGNEIVESLRDIGEEVQETFQRTREKEEVRAVSEQAKRVSETVGASLRSGEATSEVQKGVSDALRTLNAELNKLIDQLQASSARLRDEVESTASDIADEGEAALHHEGERGEVPVPGTEPTADPWQEEGEDETYG